MKRFGNNKNYFVDFIRLNNIRYIVSFNKLGIPKCIETKHAGKLEHFNDALKYGKADAVLAASLFHFRKLRIFELKEYLSNNGFIIRK